MSKVTENPQGDSLCKHAGVNSAQVLYNKTDMILFLQTNIHFIGVSKWFDLKSNRSIPLLKKDCPSHY